MKNRLSNKAELFFKNFNIEWKDSLGYIRLNNMEDEIPCSVNFIKELETLMYFYKKNKLTVGGDFYWGEGQVLGYMVKVAAIFNRENQYIRDVLGGLKNK